VYVSLVWHGGQLGMAHYDLSSLQVHMMSDALESDDFVLTKQILKEIQPCVVIMSSIQDGRLVACLRKLASENNTGCSQSPGSRTEAFKIEFLSSSDFNYEVSKRRILGMKLPSIPDHYTDEEKRVHFASILPLGQTNMVRAVGGLYKYLEKNRVGVELEDALMTVPIIGFRTFTLENYIEMDTVTYMALNIFDTEIHPSVYKFGGASGKEGLSLFGVTLYSMPRYIWVSGVTLYGMACQWFLRPSKNAAVLGQRQSAVSFFVTPRNMDVVSCLQGCLKHIKYLPKILWRMSKAQASVGDLVALSKTIYHAVYIGKISRAQPQDVEIFRKIASAFTDDLDRCANLIHRTIDFEESKRLKKFVVKPNVDEKLDEKKRLFHGVPDILNRVAREELESLSEEIDHCKASYLPQLGYLLVIDMPEGKTEYDDHTIEGLQFVFATNHQLFYKSARTQELDAQLGDTQLEISDIEVNILHGLQSAILESTQVLLDVMEMAAELDCLMALATCACEFSYTRPKLVQEEVIDIKAGRHPLQEMCCSPYVPNDTFMGGSSSRIQLLTGPNACGKSVYLKQVALIVFMSHIGSFVPAEAACVGPIDRFFSRVKSMESVSSGMSTFLQDSLQISHALSEATHNSLVIVDEFGKGTESTDGLALLTAVIKFWVKKGTAAPYVLVSTHYHSMIEQRLLLPSLHLKLLTLDTLMNGGDLVFLYQIKEGSASSSYACHIAAQVGIPQNIIKRGQQVSELLSQNKSVPSIRDNSSATQRKRYQYITEGFVHLNLEKDDIKNFLENFVLQENIFGGSNTTSEEKCKQQYTLKQQQRQTITSKKSEGCIQALPSTATGEDDEKDQNGNMSNNQDIPSAKNDGTHNLAVANEKNVKKSEVDIYKTNPAQNSHLWRNKNFRDLVLQRGTAVDALSVPNLGTAVEHFTKTPLARHQSMKRKFVAPSSSSSRDDAKSSKTDLAFTFSPQRDTDASLSESNTNTDYSETNSNMTSNLHPLSKQTNRALHTLANFTQCPEVCGIIDGTKVIPCQPLLSKLVLKNASTEVRPMFFPQESNTDLPVTSSASDSGHDEKIKENREQNQACLQQNKL
ncbi:muts protein homolog 5-like, partial [Plakobranchus ocellatus]